uniref:5-methyltetrahydropteroyltriglutamate--homocysteine S-methyltransferase n=1 Tax=Trypanosoma congolense (strain IL3000) TaxID=1068625 RepID=G0URL1_TRYCI|nr:putative 5-methyltetrahydropteroyltriglutamate-homocysteine S-methyltransferase [Trypanosoma congolense IL3000]
MIPVGDFHWYDHVLSTSLMLGNVPSRHRPYSSAFDINTLFRVARGYTSNGTPIDAAEMTKWFNTNYHYIVPEFTSPAQSFNFAWPQIIDEVDELINICGPSRTKPVILGPVTYVWLGKVRGEVCFDRRRLLPGIIPVYAELLRRFAKSGIEWVQVDEPVLVLDLEGGWLEAVEITYKMLREQVGTTPRLMLTTYFGGISHNLGAISNLPVDGLHVDAVSGRDNLHNVKKQLPTHWVLSVGAINGRNVWRADLNGIFSLLEALHHVSPTRPLWVGTSCSLLHCPIDVGCETKLGEDVKGSLAFALQKCEELSLLAHAFKTGERQQLEQYSQSIRACNTFKQVANEGAQRRMELLHVKHSERAMPYSKRAELQQKLLNLPLIPTTTIGSFPHTPELRLQRLSFKQGMVDEATYRQQMRDHIRRVIAEQEDIGLDVLVHGEPERGDMVEYFAELMDGFALTSNGWVQSYGSRLVKPPIVYGDVVRPTAMTVEWLTYAQSLTRKPVKGILTGPVTMLSWSFIREDIPVSELARQIATALRDEIDDLQNGGIRLIQVDEPALREGLPLRKHDQAAYLKWATEAFRITVSTARPETQVHTHICYSEIHDIVEAIIEMDADVILLEATRSNMETLRSFSSFEYPNGVGFGVYDIHSPNIPTVESMVKRLTACLTRIPAGRLWAHPDCGLKTRGWEEVRLSLSNMVEAAKRVREKAQGK